jgi:RNA polymerase subunit RPABC4/transcription elongation factor Spt4
MALIACPECASQISDKAPTCPQCGVPLAAAPKEVLIHFDRASSQLFNIGVTISSGGQVVARGKQGDTLRVPCTDPMDIEVKVNGWFGKPTLTIHPGERYNAKPRRVGFYLEKVDYIAGF